jgi:arabinan endo-1,5-alpha-L-arabinosidase
MSNQRELPIVYPSAPPSYAMYDRKNIHNEHEWRISNSHDPAIFKDGDTYYVFGTDVKVNGVPKPGITVRSSKDLIDWQWVGYALGGVPAEAEAWSKAEGLWAPDVVKLGNTYYLYYSASTFGSRQSFIGVATSKSITGPWVDQGEVIKTEVFDDFNAIDPNIVQDAQGNLWMAYGSFFGGIQISRLNPETGKLQNPEDSVVIARRDPIVYDGAIEGPYIIYHPEFQKYYLFASYDSLFSSYNVRVGRSDSITGPYVDVKGQRLDDMDMERSPFIGNKLIGSYRFQNGEGWLYPGHNSILNDAENGHYMVHHARGEVDSNWMYLHVRKLVWTEDGWPVVSPERYAGEKEQPIPKDAIPGTWEWISFDKTKGDLISSSSYKLLAGGKIEGTEHKWDWKQPNFVHMVLKDEGAEKTETVQAKVLPAWDWERSQPTLVITGMNSEGEAVWGKKISD